MNRYDTSSISTCASITDCNLSEMTQHDIWQEWAVDLARDVTNSSSITFSELNEMTTQSESLRGHVDVIVLTADDDSWQRPDIPPALDSVSVVPESLELDALGVWAQDVMGIPRVPVNIDNLLLERCDSASKSDN